ncbi:hypothetical protein DPMN_048903 [Dreissena polymorpha]|uniref:Uncharacterized protein n=1 Tax=Dreissena polymorpha TaxID=45954 RepID=A0A9D4DCD6_DREPO|nr:hypothetical protein DPMN_048903 [Dreissena polymorpha]
MFFLPIQTILELNRRIKETNVLTKLEKTAPPPGGHVFSLITTIFKLNQDIHKTNVLTKFMMIIQTIKKHRHPGGHVFETNVLTKFHKDRAKYKTAPSPGGHVFPPITTIFELVRNINQCFDQIHDD